MEARPTQSHYDAGLKALDLWFGRLCSCVLAATVVYGSAKLPHYIAVILIAVASVVAYAIFVGLVKLAQGIGLVGANVLKSNASSPAMLEDEIPVMPKPVVPIAAALNATGTEDLSVAWSLSSKAVDVRTVEIAGRGKVSYRIIDLGERRP